MSSSEKENLKFYGRINASISHELKNILAIISETTGFLDDLVMLARQGKALDLSILENSNKSISEEIDRGFHTIRQMNQFAHSVDDFEADADVVESLHMAANLTRFLSNSKTIHIEEPSDEITVKIAPYYFVKILYTVLCELFNADVASEIFVKLITNRDAAVQLVFSGFQMSKDRLYSGSFQTYLDQHDIEITMSRTPCEVKLTAPTKEHK